VLNDGPSDDPRSTALGVAYAKLYLLDLSSFRNSGLDIDQTVSLRRLRNRASGKIRG
jgi:hypothetical protein